MFLRGAFFLALASCLPFMVQFFTRKEYSVPNPNGAVIISGASTGIGHDAALYLDSIGYTIFAGVRKAADAAALLKERPSLKPIVFDVTDQQSIDYAFGIVRDSGVPLVAVVNNAGISRSMPLEIEDVQQVQHLLNVNVIGVIRLSQAFIPLLRENRGRIVNIGSIAGIVTQPFSGAYSASKFALEALTDAQRQELHPWGISVSIVEPGYVKTAIEGKGSAKRLFTVPSEQVALYSEALGRTDLKRAKSFQTAAGTACTDEVIGHAISSPFPRTRYPVAGAGPLPAWIVTWAVWILPDRLQDSVLALFRSM